MESQVGVAGGSGVGGFVEIPRFVGGGVGAVLGGLGAVVGALWERSGWVCTEWFRGMPREGLGEGGRGASAVVVMRSSVPSSRSRGRGGVRSCPWLRLGACSRKSRW